jgi:hypothetical protein
MSLPKQIILVLSVFYYYLFPRHRKYYHRDSSPGQFSGFWPLFLNLLFETKNFGLGSVLLSFLGFEPQKPFSPGLEPRTDVRVCNLGTLICLPKQLWFWRRSSIVLSFRARGTALSGTRTQDTCPAFWPSCVLFLVSANKHTKFGANLFIRSRAIS